MALIMMLRMARSNFNLHNNIIKLKDKTSDIFVYASHSEESTATEFLLESLDLVLSTIVNQGHQEHPVPD